MTTFKIGDKVRVISQYDEIRTIVCTNNSLANPYVLDLPVRSFVNCYRADELELVETKITFQQAYDRFLPHLPVEQTHVALIHGKLKAYRHGDTYLSMEINGLDVSFHKNEDKQIQESRGFQAFLEDAFVLLDEYEESNKPVEVTLEQVAARMGIDVKKLRIKE